MSDNNDNNKQDLFGELAENKSYQDLIQQMPEDERPFIEQFVKELFDRFKQATDIG